MQQYPEEEHKMAQPRPENDPKEVEQVLKAHIHTPECLVRKYSMDSINFSERVGKEGAAHTVKMFKEQERHSALKET